MFWRQLHISNPWCLGVPTQPMTLHRSYVYVHRYQNVSLLTSHRVTRTTNIAYIYTAKCQHVAERPHSFIIRISLLEHPSLLHSSCSQRSTEKKHGSSNKSVGTRTPVFQRLG